MFLNINCIIIREEGHGYIPLIHKVRNEIVLHEFHFEYIFFNVTAFGLILA